MMMRQRACVNLNRVVSKNFCCGERERAACVERNRDLLQQRFGAHRYELRRCGQNRDLCRGAMHLIGDKAKNEQRQEHLEQAKSPQTTFLTSQCLQSFAHQLLYNTSMILR